MVSFLREGVLWWFSGGYAWESFVKGVFENLDYGVLVLNFVFCHKMGFWGFSPIPLEFPVYPPPRGIFGVFGEKIIMDGGAGPHPPHS